MFALRAQEDRDVDLEWQFVRETCLWHPPLRYYRNCCVSYHTQSSPQEAEQEGSKRKIYKCIKEVGLQGVVESRVATAGMLMHKNILGRDNRARERSPHRSQEQVEILKELATLIAARTTRGRPGQASVAVQQCMTQFGLYSDFKMTPQEGNREHLAHSYHCYSRCCQL